MVGAGVGVGADAGAATGAGAGFVATAGAAAGAEADAGAAGGFTAAALAAPESLFNSSTFFDNSATRTSSAFFARSFEIWSSALVPAAPLLRVSLSGVAAAPGLRSSTEACTLPLAWREEPSARAVGTAPARRWR